MKNMLHIRSLGVFWERRFGKEGDHKLGHISAEFRRPRATLTLCPARISLLLPSSSLLATKLNPGSMSTPTRPLRKKQFRGPYFAHCDLSDSDEIPSTPLEPVARLQPWSSGSQTPRVERVKEEEEVVVLSDSESENDGEVRDGLSRLPVDILQRIFSDVRIGNFYSISPIIITHTAISKSLRRFTDSMLYTDVVLSSPPALTKFCSTLRPLKRHHLGALVSYLHITVPTKGSSGKTPADSTFQTAFSSLINLRTLKIEGHPRLSNLVITGLIHGPIQSRRLVLQRLSELTIKGVYGPEVTALDSRLYANLNAFPLLHSFSLALIDIPAISPLPFRPDISPLTPLAGIPRVKKLKLEAPLADARSHSHILSLLNSFPSVLDLSLHDTSSSPNLPYLLATIQPQYTSLQISAVAPQILPAIPTMNFQRFEGLISLILGPGTFDESMDYNFFRSLRLEKLGWSLGSRIKLSPLCALVSGATKHPTLQTLLLDIVDGSFPPIPPESKGKERERITSKTVGWKLPDWTEDISPNRSRAFLKLAKCAGVRVEGSIRWALAVQDAYDGRPVDFEEMIGGV
ncbi:hypothetical protein P7C70_g8951, partial [Phenoliferia sp. Uapishka_3]